MEDEYGEYGPYYELRDGKGRYKEIIGKDDNVSDVSSKIYGYGVSADYVSERVDHISQDELQNELSKPHEKIERMKDPESEAYKDKGTVRNKKIDHSSMNMEMKQCYKNSQLKSMDNSDFNYVEGLIVMDDIPLAIKHAWVEDDDTIYELTLDEKPEQYYGVEYSTEDVSKQLSETGKADTLINIKDYL